LWLRRPWVRTPSLAPSI